MPWISAAVGIGSAIFGASSQKKAAKAAAAEREKGYQRVVGGDLGQTYAPGGAAAFNQAQQLLGIGGPQQPAQIDPATGQPIAGTGSQSQAGFQNYLDSAGYKTQLNAGIDALNSNAAARGMLKSGATLKATQRFGSGLGQQYFNNYIGQLMSQSNQGLSANQTIASAATGVASGNAGAQMQVGAAQAQGWGGAAKNVVGAIRDSRPPTG